MAAVELSKALIIVIAVSGAFGCIALLFLIFKCFHRSKSTPLPPTQPLAHQRERESKFVSYPCTSRKSIALDRVGLYGSETSLKPSRLSSYQTDESAGAASSSCHSLPPHPPPIPTIPVYLPGPRSVESGSGEGPPSLGETRPRRPSRTNSTPFAASSSTHVSTRSLNTGNHVRVVLPTPLAPQLQYHMVANPSTIESKGGLVGNSDRWMRVPNRSTSWRAKSDQSFSDASPERGFRSSIRNYLPPPRRPTHPVLVREVPHQPPSILKYNPPAPPPRPFMKDNAPIRALGPGRDPHRLPRNTPKPPSP